MKLLTITVPSYNSQDYLGRCIKSLLLGDEALMQGVEIIIVNDGSTDNTQRIADEFALRFPSIIKVVNQENGGHGDAVTTGINAATGKYFKVVDSDDYLNQGALKALLTKLFEFEQKGEYADMIISNYVYNKAGKRKNKVISYEKTLPIGKMFSWNDVASFKIGQYLLMHALIYRTDILKDNHFTLPKHAFYVDNLYAYVPMQYVDKIYYLNVDLYMYSIGREGQSVQEDIMIKRIDQQILVNKTMLNSVDLGSVSNPKQQEYLYHYLEIITTVTSILLLKSGTPENLAKKRELWDYIKARDPQAHSKFRKGLMGRGLHLPGLLGRQAILLVYKISQGIFGFN